MNMSSAKCKIVFLIRSLNYGGAERQLVTLVERLAQNDVNLTVLCFYKGGDLAQVLRENNINLIHLDKTKRWDIIDFLFPTSLVIKELNPNVLYSYGVVPNILVSLIKILKIIPVSTRIIWSIRASNVDLSQYNWLSSITFQFQSSLSWSPDLIIANSKAGRDYHVTKGFPKNKIVVIPNGIDTNKFQNNLKQRQLIRSEWKIPEQAILIGLVARLDPMKDHATFLKAVALMAKKRKDIIFACIGHGDPNYTHQLYDFCDKLGLTERVLWVGNRLDIHNIYSALDILTSSSSYGEGFSNVIGEAMSCCIPCVVTNVGDSAWIVGNTGVVVPPKNPEALVYGWEQCLQQDRMKMGLEARKRISEHFSVDQLVEKTKFQIHQIYKFE